VANHCLIGLLLVLLALEQYAYSATHATRYVVIGLLVARMLLIEAVTAVDASGLSRVLYAIVPFTAYFSLGKRVSYGLAIFYMSLFIVKLCLFVPVWYTNKEAISGC